jgi:hypothetical protein
VELNSKTTRKEATRKKMMKKMERVIIRTMRMKMRTGKILARSMIITTMARCEM